MIKVSLKKQAEGYSESVQAVQPENSVQKFIPAKPERKFGIKFSQRELVTLVVILVLALGGAITLYVLKQNELDALKGQVAGTQTTAEYQTMLDSIKKLVTIPADETVRIALVDDPAKLIAENPTFYANVKTGQYLVIMPKTQKVLIYDKVENKIVNFSSYSIKVDLIPESDIAASEKPLNIEIRVQNGVADSTVTTIKNALEKASTNYKITATTSTTKTDFSGLTLVLLNKTNKPKMSQNIIASTGINNIVDVMPGGEAASTADVVIIVGKV